MFKYLLTTFRLNQEIISVGASVVVVGLYSAANYTILTGGHSNLSEMSFDVLFVQSLNSDWNVDHCVSSSSARDNKN